MGPIISEHPGPGPSVKPARPNPQDKQPGRRPSFPVNHQTHLSLPPPLPKGLTHYTPPHADIMTPPHRRWAPRPALIVVLAAAVLLFAAAAEASTGDKSYFFKDCVRVCVLFPLPAYSFPAHPCPVRRPVGGFQLRQENR